MARPIKCVQKHRVLFVDQWTPLGAFVTCICGTSFFASQPLLDEWYLPFQYTSPDGPAEDKGIFVWEPEMRGR